MSAMESGFVMLSPRFDLEVVAGRWRIIGVIDLNILAQREVSICVCVWIWLSIGQVGEEYTLVVVCDNASLLHSQRVHLLEME